MRLTLLIALTGCALRADTVIVNAYTLFAYTPTTFPGYSDTGIVIAPGFNPQWGSLLSVTIDWSATITSFEHYKTGTGDDFAFVPLQFTQIATASAFGLSSSITQSVSALARGGICHTCGVETTVTVSGSGDITDPAELNGFIGDEIWGLATAFVNGQSDDGLITAWITEGFLYPEPADWNAILTYAYVPVPEPRWVAAGIFVVAACCRLKRRI